MYLVSLLCEGGVASCNSYNRMSAPTALGPEHLPDVEALAVGERGVYHVSLLCEGGVASCNSYNRMSAPAGLGPKQLPDEKALAVGGGWGSTLYPSL